MTQHILSIHPRTTCIGGQSCYILSYLSVQKEQNNMHWWPVLQHVIQFISPRTTCLGGQSCYILSNPSQNMHWWPVMTQHILSIHPRTACLGGQSCYILSYLSFKNNRTTCIGGQSCYILSDLSVPYQQDNMSWWPVLLHLIPFISPISTGQHVLVASPATSYPIYQSKNKMPW